MSNIPRIVVLEDGKSVVIVFGSGKTITIYPKENGYVQITAGVGTHIETDHTIWRDVVLVSVREDREKKNDP